MGLEEYEAREISDNRVDRDSSAGFSSTFDKVMAIIAIVVIVIVAITG